MTVVAVPHAAASAASVRRLLAAELTAAGASATGRADAELVVTELVTNAVRYAAPVNDSGIEVGWRAADGRLLLWVSDGGSESGSPRPRPPSVTAASGRGLAIVAAVTERWGVREEAQRRTVWAQVRLPAERYYL